MRIDLRLRTKLLLAMVLVSAAMTATTLGLVSGMIERRERSRIAQDLSSSVRSFQDAERQREDAQLRAASLMADLPIVRALMTTRDTATIQDASADLWRVANSDLFLLAAQTTRVLALHVRSGRLSATDAQRFVTTSLSSGRETDLWLANGHLYEVALKPIYFGPTDRGNILGFIAIGFEIDEDVARELGQLSGGEVAFRSGNSLLRSTLPPEQQRALEQANLASLRGGRDRPIELQLAGERYLATTLDLSSSGRGEIELTVLKSLDQATRFRQFLNRLLLILGLIAVVAGSGLIFVISRTITRPLDKLLDSVRALGGGDYHFPLPIRTRDEVGELTSAFDQMRQRLHQAQRELLQAERLATIGQMASSISHDLRHHLAAVYANAEFLLDARRTGPEREELYQEVRLAVMEMTDLIESLVEFSRTRESLRREEADIGEVLEHAIAAVRLHRMYQYVLIDVHCDGDMEAFLDPKKLERVFHNLLLNACAAVPAETGIVRVVAAGEQQQVLITIADNGCGIPDEAQGRIFEPFFSYGKENGTGLGLNVALKIVQDHGGELTLERTSPAGTVFKVVLPRAKSDLHTSARKVGANIEAVT